MKKHTTKALITSVLSMLLCVSMLIGSTFAWFTDTATTGVNTIVSGNLDVALEMYKDGEWVNAEGETLEFIKAEGGEGEEILWEPGCTYKLPDIRVINNGNLWLKYQIQITGIQGDAKLNEVIEWTFNDTTLTAEGALEPEDFTDPITIKGHMKEEAGNEYKDLTIDGIAITVIATQKDAEFDSFGNDYDADALFLAAKVAKIAKENLTVAAATNFGNMNETAPVTLDTGYTFTAVDPGDDAKMSEYKQWHADFVVSADQDIPAGALTLAGQYDAWSANWLAFTNPDLVASGKETRLLQSAGVTVNYDELCNTVKEFNCGAMGKNLAGTTLTVELRLYEATGAGIETETGEYMTIGSYSYTFVADQLPTADVEELTGDALTVSATNGLGGAAAPLTLDTGYTFAAIDTAEEAANSDYAEWHADFVVTVDTLVPAGALTLAGQYDGWSEDWVAFQNPAEVAADAETRLLAYVGGELTYAELCSLVKEFNCGATATDALDNATMTVELRLYEVVNGTETGNYEVIGSYSYTFGA